MEEHEYDIGKVSVCFEKGWNLISKDNDTAIAQECYGRLLECNVIFQNKRRQSKIYRPSSLASNCGKPRNVRQCDSTLTSAKYWYCY